MFIYKVCIILSSSYLIRGWMKKISISFRADDQETNLKSISSILHFDQVFWRIVNE